MEGLFTNPCSNRTRDKRSVDLDWALRNLYYEDGGTLYQVAQGGGEVQARLDGAPSNLV